MTKNVDKSKFTYNGQILAFDGKGFWSVINDIARNLVIFGAGNSSSPHTDNPKHYFLMLEEGPLILMIALVQQKKNSINFSKADTKFSLSLHYNGDEIYLYVNKTGIY